jgi:hypothetical protein
LLLQPQLLTALQDKTQVSALSGRRESNPRSQFGRLGLYH